MMRIQLIIALTAIFGMVGTTQAETPEANAIKHLSAALATDDPVRILFAYRAMGKSALPAARFVESTVNDLGRQLLENGESAAAIRALKMNAETFRLSANAWRSLAEVSLTRGDRKAALRYYRLSLDLDLDNSHAEEMVALLSNELQAQLD